MSFSVFILLNTKEEILKNVGKQLLMDFYRNTVEVNEEQNLFCVQQEMMTELFCRTNTLTINKTMKKLKY